MATRQQTAQPAIVDEAGLMGINEAAKFLDVARPMIYRLMDDGSIPFVRVGSRRKIARKSLVDFVSRNAVVSKTRL